MSNFDKKFKIRQKFQILMEIEKFAKKIFSQNTWDFGESCVFGQTHRIYGKILISTKILDFG